MEVLHYNGNSGFYSPATLTSTSNTVEISSINNCQSPFPIDAPCLKLDNDVNRSQECKRSFKRLNWSIPATNLLLGKHSNCEGKNGWKSGLEMYKDSDNPVNLSLLNNDKLSDCKLLLNFNNFCVSTKDKDKFTLFIGKSPRNSSSSTNLLTPSNSFDKLSKDCVDCQVYAPNRNKILNTPNQSKVYAAQVSTIGAPKIIIESKLQPRSPTLLPLSESLRPPSPIIIKNEKIVPSGVIEQNNVSKDWHGLIINKESLKHVNKDNFDAEILSRYSAISSQCSLNSHIIGDDLGYNNERRVSSASAARLSDGSEVEWL